MSDKDRIDVAIEAYQDVWDHASFAANDDVSRYYVERLCMKAAIEAAAAWQEPADPNADVHEIFITGVVPDGYTSERLGPNTVRVIRPDGSSVDVTVD